MSVLHHNQVTHRCSFTILIGAVSKIPLAMDHTDAGGRRLVSLGKGYVREIGLCKMFKVESF